MKNHLKWIDIFKGIGILCVVYGHLRSGIIRDFIYLFHMPLFFFVSGYLIKPTLAYKDYLKKKTIHLLIPYIIFFICMIPLYVIDGDNSFKHNLFNVLYGGRLLTKWAGVVWFITCLFLTQQLFNFLATKLTKKGLAFSMIVCLIIAYANAMFFSDIILPWNINVVFYSLPVFYTGYIYKLYGESILDKYKWIVIITFFISIIIFYFTNPAITLDINTANYGIPMISFFCSTSIILFIAMALKIISANLKYASVIMAYIGQASMIIMYYHSPVYYILGNLLHINPHIAIFSMIAVPVFMFYIFNKNRMTKLLFLGIY